MYRTIKNITLNITKENRSKAVVPTTPLTINSEFLPTCWTLISTPLYSRQFKFNIFRSKFYLPFPWGFPSPCPLHPAFPLLVLGHFSQLGALGSSLTHVCTESSYLLHPISLHILLILPLKCLLNPPHHSI